MKDGSENLTRMGEWNISTPDAAGLHHCVRPGRQDCREVNVLRLNLAKGGGFLLKSDELEMNAALIRGSVEISGGCLNGKLAKLDSFYVPGNSQVEIRAAEDATFYIGAAVCEGYGKPFIRQFDKNLPIGDIRQIHGRDAGRREVFFTLNPEIPASRLICGLTWGGNGGWTSWPPHQHEKDLEEVYCYFDMDKPKFGLHLSYMKSGEIGDLAAHPVHSGSFVLAPCGYHPTVASPGVVNAYFWVLAAFCHESRRYDLAKLDPAYAGT
jgi:5-deoxy-glucuronate isomerase